MKFTNSDKFENLIQFVREVKELPRVTIDLQYCFAKKNCDFFRDYVKDFHKQTQRQHSKFKIVKAMSLGVALKELENSWDDYFMSIDGSARRNCKKALREGFTVGQISFNDWLQDIHEIVTSAEERQGRPMPKSLLDEGVRPNRNPPTLDPRHDYVFYGVEKDGRLVAYAGCFICGEVCMIESIYGHSSFQTSGVVPLLITEIAKDIISTRETVKYYVYGTTYGARKSMQRFKQKFRFNPARVHWKLGEKE